VTGVFMKKDGLMNSIKDKVFSNKRISVQDALFLFESDDIITLGELADCRLKSAAEAPREVYYSYNININPTNICRLRCKLCAFSKSPGDDGAYSQTAGEILSRVKKALKANPGEHIEAHIVGGLDPAYDLSFYESLLRRLKALSDKITVQAFTAVEIDYLSKLDKISADEVLKALKKAGLDAMPGGGAEIFNDEIRSVICEKKIKSREWLDIMKKAHAHGIPTNATMLYGHVETDSDRVRHLELLRELQDETSGFKSFVPLAFHDKNAIVKKKRYTSGIDDLKVLAVSRIFLDNFSNVKALHNMLGLKFAQTTLFFGANDLGGTSFDERIVKAAGACQAAEVSEADLVRLIEGAQKIAVRTDSTYSLKMKRSL